MGYLVGIVIGGILLCSLIPVLFTAFFYLGSLFLVVSGLVAFTIGLIEFVTAAFDGFTPYGPTAHLRVDPASRKPGADPAYRSYYAGPVLLDYRKVLTQAISRTWARVVADDPKTRPDPRFSRSLAGKTWDRARDSSLNHAVTYSFAVAVIAGLVLGATAAGAFLVVVSAVFAVLLALLVLVAMVTAGVSWVFEIGVLWMRGITIECPTCHERATRPIYRCPNCRAEHKKLLPGTAGVLHRTCRCEKVLPTLLANGKADLPAQCAGCASQLPIGGLIAPTVHIPVIAGPTAGKSVYMFSAVSRLLVLNDGFEFADERAKQDFERNLQRGVYDDPNRALKTVLTRPRAYNLYVGGGRARRLLYLYDPAGEIPESPDQLAEAQFLKHTKGVVFVVDPFSLRQVRSEADRSVLGRVHASNTPPKTSLERFVEAQREHLEVKAGGPLKMPVAVVLTKADALMTRSSGTDHPYAGMTTTSRAERDAAVRAWLDAAGQRDLLASIDNQFATVAYFVVSYEDAREVTSHDSPAGGVLNDDPAAPVLWLINRKAVS
ncbi:TRAFAC clade GTPase domain-containing protein [Amycolatopsis sp. MEPSY49]|uniref:TRAFAC clade GTPase domain-containing protein n=1 Tax=Amycolatopsis sp. MEPSY49 TaxID=3151600 RepID=UPI003EF51776